MLIHCHKKLKSEALAELSALSAKATIIFREQGVLNIIQNSVAESANVFYLAKDFDTYKTNLPQQATEVNRQLISAEEFVELCFNASKIIAWK